MARVATGESVLSRVIRVVESFGVGDTDLTVSEIARRSGLHISTASRLIEEMVGYGWLERSGRRIRVGVRLWEVASRASATVGLRESALPFMEDLQAVVGQHTQLAVREGDEVLFVERLSAAGATTNFSRVAGRLPLHASSAGLVLLAHSSPELQDSVMKRPLAAFTPRTIHTETELRTTLGEVRRQGFALCAGHLYPETTGVAVPVRSPDGVVVAALGLVVPSTPDARPLVPVLLATARALSRVLVSTQRPTR